MILALLMLLAGAFSLGYALRPVPDGVTPRRSIAARIYCEDCGGARLVTPFGSCFTCGSDSVAHL